MGIITNLVRHRREDFTTETQRHRGAQRDEKGLRAEGARALFSVRPCASVSLWFVFLDRATTAMWT